jgi:uncharacterized membrane-anchored protein YitT (DUF2179 family)
VKLLIKELVNLALIVAGIFSAGFGLKGFLLLSHFIDGGVTGVSMLLAAVLQFPLSVLLLLINISLHCSWLQANRD